VRPPLFCDSTTLLLPETTDSTAVRLPSAGISVTMKLQKEMITVFEIDRKKFGAFVGELRKEQGYTQKELAQKLYISDKAVSKWETGNSVPDTALLIPLAELLGVTVTELLMCRRVEEAPIPAEQVESVVKTAITYSDERTARAYQAKSIWPVIYLCSVLLGCIGLLICSRRQILTEDVTTAVLLGGIFGAYFCFFVKTKLPAFYDANRCGLYYDGPFRMNVPGVTFTNANWPYIVRVGRIWTCVSVALFPLLNVLLHWASSELWAQIHLYVFLFLLLGGLFLPIYIVGRKYE